MTKIQIDAQKVIAENQAQSEERIMKNQREEMRSLAVLLAKELRAPLSGNPPNKIFETSPQNVIGVTDPSGSQISTKKPSTVNTKSTASHTSSLQQTLSKQSSTGKNRRQSDSLDDNHTSKYQAIDHTSKMIKASANTDNSIGIDSFTSTDNVDDLSMDPPLSVINYATQLNGDSEMIQDYPDHPFTAPTHQDPLNPRQC